MIREKKLKRIITFSNTTDAMAFEDYCRINGVPGRLIPVPGEIAAGCGMCWMAPMEEAGPAEELCRGGYPHEGMFEIMLY